MKVFISGISTGIGRELAILLLQKGHDVWGVARSEKLLEELKTEYDQLKYSVCDVRYKDNLRQVKETMDHLAFSPEVIVLNAAVYPNDPLKHYNETIETNLLGALHCVELFLPDIIKNKKGQFIALSSLFAELPDDRNFAYAASKAGLSMAMKCLRLNYREDGILFKNVYLGPVSTTINKESRQNRFLTTSTEKIASNILNIMYSRRSNFYLTLTNLIAIKIFPILPKTLLRALYRFLRR